MSLTHGVSVAYTSSRRGIRMIVIAIGTCTAGMHGLEVGLGHVRHVVPVLNKTDFWNHPRRVT